MNQALAENGDEEIMEVGDHGILDDSKELVLNIDESEVVDMIDNSGDPRVR